MPKIAILLPAMRMGGAEKVFLNFLPYLFKDYDTTIILNKKEGELLDFLPNNIKIIEDRLLNFTEIVKIDSKKCDFINLFKDLIYYLKVKLKISPEKNYRYLISRTPKLEYKFDCAISYVANVSTQIFSIIDRINADKKVAWIHGETIELKDTKLFEKYYNSFNKIFCVSNITKEHFINRFKSCENIVDVYYNHINREEIIEKSKENIDFEFDKDKINIVSVGRLSPEKGFEMIPEIIKILNQSNYNIEWYLVGEGPVRKKIEEKIKEFDLDGKLILTGNQINPYPFIKQCDIYVQPSYEEGYSTTVCEAAILEKPIIGTTTSGGIYEQLTDGKTGILAEPNPISISKNIELLINNKELKESIIKNVQKLDFSNSKEFEKFEKFIK